ncbi:AsnC family protein [Actinoplanes subtropicus]
MLHALQVDGRAPFSCIVEILEVSDQTVARSFANCAPPPDSGSSA